VALSLPASLRYGAALGGLTFAALLGYAHFVEPRRLRIERWTVRIPNLPPAWEGMRVVHLTDFQIGMWLQDASLPARAVAAAVALHPDVVFLTGDFAHGGRWEHQDGVYAPLARRAPTFAVLGNHDHTGPDSTVERVATGLRAQGVTVLMNAHAPLEWRGESWMIVGVDDFATGHTDLLRAITGIPRNTRLLALLTHVPDVVDYLPREWFPLTVAGHTHGAQVRLSPFQRVSWLSLANVPRRTKYPRGWFEVNGGILYVNRGLGLSNLPLRFGAPPEVALFVLTDGSALPDGVRWRRCQAGEAGFVDSRRWAR
jgi:predicted MPP superfamily phosphohydrolase